MHDTRSRPANVVRDSYTVKVLAKCVHTPENPGYSGLGPLYLRDDFDGVADVEFVVQYPGNL